MHLKMRKTASELLLLLLGFLQACDSKIRLLSQDHQQHRVQDGASPMTISC